MQPDFSKPAFSLVALSSLALAPTTGKRQFRSDHRCQLRYTGDSELFESRVCFVSADLAAAGTEVPTIVAFLSAELDRARCKPGAQFELLEGETATATGKGPRICSSLALVSGCSCCLWEVAQRVRRPELRRHPWTQRVVRRLQAPARGRHWRFHSRMTATQNALSGRLRLV